MHSKHVCLQGMCIICKLALLQYTTIYNSLTLGHNFDIVYTYTLHYIVHFSIAFTRCVLMKCMTVKLDFVIKIKNPRQPCHHDTCIFTYSWGLSPEEVICVFIFTLCTRGETSEHVTYQNCLVATWKLWCVANSHNLLKLERKKFI